MCVASLTTGHPVTTLISGPPSGTASSMDGLAGPSVRPLRILAARRALQEGEYSRDDIIDRTAELVCDCLAARLHL